MMALPLIHTQYSFIDPFKQDSLGSNYMESIVIIDLGNNLVKNIEIPSLKRGNILVRLVSCAVVMVTPQSISFVTTRTVSPV